MKKSQISDVLANRYASPEMTEIWSAEGKIKMERELWIAVLEAQKSLGLKISTTDINRYKKVKDKVNLESIAKIEKKTRHDVKARIEEFNKLAGGLELIHKGMTSRDLTDNVEQYQILISLKLIRDRSVSVLNQLSQLSAKYKTLEMCGRSHYVPAQITTLGKKFATITNEMLISFNKLEELIESYPLRGIKGPMGTSQDMAKLLGKENAIRLDKKVLAHLGFKNSLDSVGQVYPRSLDFSVTSTLLQLSSSAGNFAVLIRQMAGHEQAHEGFKEGQTGSSAMPHKMNSRSCERINGFVNVLRGYNTMTEGMLANQWHEGDVSCSVTRRVAIQGAFFAIDGMFETFLTVLKELQVYPLVIKDELEHYLPFLSTTKILLTATERGLGREQAHQIVKKYATEAIKNMRENTSSKLKLEINENEFIYNLANDTDFPLNLNELKELIIKTDHGLAEQQVNAVVSEVNKIVKKYPKAVKYSPKDIL